jgi:hypothetical protein
MGFGSNRGSDINRINSMLAQFQSMISCDGPCQKKKEEERLKQKMIDAETNLQSAPSEFQLAQKNYITYTQGEDAYNELNEEQLRDRANEIAKEYEENYDEFTEKIKTQIEVYESIFFNFENVMDLYLKYKKENDELFKQLKNTTSDVLTNERKTFYQDQQVDTLKFYYYYIILIIYCVCVFCFAIFSFIYPSKIDWKIRLAIYILFNLLPFVATWFLGLIIYIFYIMYEIIPKNVYKEELDVKTNYNYFKNLY